MKDKPRVAFVCVHNSCRSQMAEALGQHLAADVFDSYSAGTETVPQINQDAVATVQRLYCVDMAGQQSKLVGSLPPVDIVVTMGCNVACPTLPCQHREDWGLADPTGKGHAAFEETAKAIHDKVLALKGRIQNNTLGE